MHDHAHGTIDPTLLTTSRGIWAVKWSLVLLGLTAIFQVVIVVLTNSIALLADTIHNFGDAATAIPLWIAFSLARRKPSTRYTYGYGRVEDWAGIMVVLAILVSAAVAGYRSVERLFHPEPLTHVWAIIVASIIGFIGNELVAVFRIRVGKEINSAALIADGYHARIDGLTSLAVLFGAVGVQLGYPLADPIVGLGITVAILRIVWQSAAAVFPRLIDGVDPHVIEDIRHTAGHVQGVHGVTEVRARWLGHRLHAEVNIAVSPNISVTEGHAIAMELRHQLLHHLPYISNATIHVDPNSASGEASHRIAEHKHGEYPDHSHP